MKNNPIDLTDLFIRHSRKQLSENELTDFNQKLTNNTDFKNAFEEYELSRNFFIQKELFDVKDLLTEFKNTPPPSPNYTNYWIGGTFLFLLIGISTFFGLQKNTVEKETVVFSPTIIDPTEEINNNIIDSVTLEKEIAIAPEKQEIISTPEKTISKKEIVNDEPEIKNIKDIPTKIIDIKNNETNKKLVSEKAVIDESSVEEVVIAKPCPTISFDVLTKEPCKNQDNGDLQLTNVQGGTSPYVFIIESEEQKEAYFRNLTSGNYHLKIIDQKGCFVEKDFLLKSQLCIQKDYEFSYNYQSYLEIPIQENGNFTILSKEGKRLVSLNLTNEDLTEWNGLDSQGNELSVGLYPIIITTNNEKTTGSLRIYP